MFAHPVSWKCSMQASYTRLYTNRDGLSRFEDLGTALSAGLSVPPADPVHSAPFLEADGATFWIGIPEDWRGGTPHPAPRRMILFTVEGEYEIATADDITRRFPAGSVLIIEDTTGSGHSTRVTSAGGLMLLAVGLAAK